MLEREEMAMEKFASKKFRQNPKKSQSSHNLLTQTPENSENDDEEKKHVRKNAQTSSEVANTDLEGSGDNNEEEERGEKKHGSLQSLSKHTQRTQRTQTFRIL